MLNWVFQGGAELMSHFRLAIERAGGRVAIPGIVVRDRV